MCVVLFLISLHRPVWGTSSCMFTKTYYIFLEVITTPSALYFLCVYFLCDQYLALGHFCIIALCVVSA